MFVHKCLRIMYKMVHSITQTMGTTASALLLHCPKVQWSPWLLPLEGFRIPLLNLKLEVCVAGGEILATESIKAAYTRGHGTLVLRGVAKIQSGPRSKRRAGRSGKQSSIIITELPYQISKASDFGLM